MKPNGVPPSGIDDWEIDIRPLPISFLQSKKKLELHLNLPHCICSPWFVPESHPFHTIPLEQPDAVKIPVGCETLIQQKVHGPIPEVTTPDRIFACLILIWNLQFCLLELEVVYWATCMLFNKRNVLESKYWMPSVWSWQAQCWMWLWAYLASRLQYSGV